jgi:hypothetical protein
MVVPLVLHGVSAPITSSISAALHWYVDPTEFGFHPEAAKRLDECAELIAPTVQALQALQGTAAHTPDLHPVEHIGPEDILSQPKFVFESNPLGEIVGFFWLSRSMRVGWVGPAFEPIKAVVDVMAQTKPFRDFVSARFLLEQTCHWLCDTLERRRSDRLSEYVTLRSKEAIRDHDIWIPLFQTYSSTEFSIGDVRFQIFTREIMDEWWSRIPAKIRDDSLSIAALNKRRSELQAILAACVTVHAEERKAVEIARSKAQNATALLRFLSPANLNSGLASYCTPTTVGGVRVSLDPERMAIDRQSDKHHTFFAANYLREPLCAGPHLMY